MKINVKDLAASIDAYQFKRQERLALEKDVQDLKDEEIALRDGIVEALKKNSLTSAGGTTHTFVITKKREPSVTDWDALYKYIKKKSAFDLLQRRLSSLAMRERWDEGEEVPGVVGVEVESVSLSRNRKMR